MPRRPPLRAARRLPVLLLACLALPAVAEREASLHPSTGAAADPGVLLRVEQPDHLDPQGNIDGTGGPPARFGAAAVLLPDINADGLPELAVGAPDQHVPRPDSSRPVARAGRVHVADGATGELIDVWRAPEPVSPDDTSARGGNFGRRLFVAGDVTGDGAVEVGVEERGALHLISVPAPREAAVAATFEGIRRAFPFPDRDGDGRDELLLHRSADGAYEVVDPATRRVLRRREGGAAPATAVGDLTRDSVPELLAGRSVLDVVTGERIVELATPAAPVEAVALDDLDRDGRADLAVALPGAALLVSTRTGRALARLERPAAGEPSDFPRGLAAPGDLDGDGIDDVVVGDLPTRTDVPPGTPGTEIPAGVEQNWLHLFSGADGRHLATVSTGDLGIRPLTGLFGSTPDRDGDGRRDLLAGGGRPLPTGGSGTELVPGAVLWLSSSLFRVR